MVMRLGKKNPTEAGLKDRPTGLMKRYSPTDGEITA
jgi:hypothetical protein